MSIDINGKLKKIFQIEDGKLLSGKTIKKCNFLLEKIYDRPEVMLITAWGKVVEQLAEFKIGSAIFVECKIKYSNKFGKKGNVIKALKISSGYEEDNNNFVSFVETIEDKYGYTHTEEITKDLNNPTVIFREVKNSVFTGDFVDCEKEKLETGVPKKEDIELSYPLVKEINERVKAILNDPKLLEEEASKVFCPKNL